MEAAPQVATIVLNLLAQVYFSLRDSAPSAVTCPTLFI